MKPPVMSAPWLAGIPNGYVLKSICGTVISRLSSATAKCWSSAEPGGLSIVPRLAIAAVTFVNSFWPVEENPNWTSGLPPVSVYC